MKPEFIYHVTKLLSTRSYTSAKLSVHLHFTIFLCTILYQKPWAMHSLMPFCTEVSLPMCSYKPLNQYVILNEICAW